MYSIQQNFQQETNTNFLGLRTGIVSVEQTDQIVNKEENKVCILIHSSHNMKCTLFNYVIIPNQYSFVDLITPFIKEEKCQHCENNISQHTTSLIYNNIKLSISTSLIKQYDQNNGIAVKCLYCQQRSELYSLMETIRGIILNDFISEISSQQTFEFPTFPQLPCEHYLHHVVEIYVNNKLINMKISQYEPYTMYPERGQIQNNQQMNIINEVSEMNNNFIKELTMLRKKIGRVQTSFEARKDFHDRLNDMEITYLGRSLVDLSPSDIIQCQTEFCDKVVEFNNELMIEINKTEVALLRVDEMSKSPNAAFRNDKKMTVTGYISMNDKKTSMYTPMEKKQSLYGLPSMTDKKASLYNSQPFDEKQNTQTLPLNVQTIVSREDEGLKLKMIWKEQIVVIYENMYFTIAPSIMPTLLAFALCTKSYNNYLNQNKLTYSYDEINESTLKRIVSPQSKPHFELKYSTIINTVPVLIDITLHFACQFHLSRLMYSKSIQLENPQNDFIQSIAYATKTVTEGGKSRSAFYKTSDGCFLFKELRGPELEAFLQTGGMEYFNYTLTLPENKTYLVRNLGVFTAALKIGNGKTEKVTYLLMENLWYGKEPTKTYDLKGTLKKRTIEASEQKVGLDGNFVRSLIKKPIIISKQTKYELLNNIMRDTQCLATSNVMDYSLIVGSYEQEKQLKVGIIDFIRTYTWDKQLESVVKKISSLGENPTVIEPELYRKRLLGFINSMFMIMPDDTFLD